MITRNIHRFRFNVSITWVDGGPCPGQYMCHDSSCIDWTKVCDEKHDCLQGEDEESCREKNIL